MKKKCCKKELLFVAFGAGCILAICLPAAWLLRILSVTVIILGIICCTK